MRKLFFNRAVYTINRMVIIHWIASQPTGFSLSTARIASWFLCSARQSRCSQSRGRRSAFSPWNPHRVRNFLRKLFFKRAVYFNLIKRLIFTGLLLNQQQFSLSTTRIASCFYAPLGKPMLAIQGETLRFLPLGTPIG